MALVFPEVHPRNSSLFQSRIDPSLYNSLFYGTNFTIVVDDRKEAHTMVQSRLMQQNRDEQRDEIMKKTAGERLQAALELSDACILLNSAARRALEEKRAVAEA